MKVEQGNEMNPMGLKNFTESFLRRLSTKLNWKEEEKIPLSSIINGVNNLRQESVITKDEKFNEISITRYVTLMDQWVSVVYRSDIPPTEGKKTNKEKVSWFFLFTGNSLVETSKIRVSDGQRLKFPQEEKIGVLSTVVSTKFDLASVNKTIYPRILSNPR
jgi:hypothetical protein